MLYINDKKYRKIVRCITKSDAFKETYNIEHHGISRMEHLTKVSYYSYNIAKKIIATIIWQINFCVTVRPSFIPRLSDKKSSKNPIKAYKTIGSRA